MQSVCEVVWLRCLLIKTRLTKFLSFKAFRVELLYLYLLHSEVQEGVLVTDADQALGALTSHAGTQASIQLHHHQFVQAVGHIVRQASSGNLIIRLNLEERKEMAAGQEKKANKQK